MADFLRKVAQRYGRIRMGMIISFCAFVICLLPQYGLAADADRTSKAPIGGGAFLAWLICYLRRKKPIGGWLLYYFIALYVGAYISAILTLSSLSNYNPSGWDDKLQYFLFIITSIPGDIFLIAQVVLSFYLISQKRRDWKYVEMLKKVLLASFIFSVASIPVDLSYWPESSFFTIYSAILAIIWFFYFKNSLRVQFVFKEKVWDENTIYSSPAVKKNNQSFSAKRFLTEKTNKVKQFATVSTVGRSAAAILLFTALGDFDHDFYTILRFIICAVCSYCVYISYGLKKKFWLWAFGLIAAFFNPFKPIHLERETWSFIDVSVGIFLLLSIALIREQDEKKVKIEKTSL